MSAVDNNDSKKKKTQDFKLQNHDNPECYCHFLFRRSSGRVLGNFLGPLEGLLEASRGSFGCLLEASWRLLEALGAVLATSWALCRR